MATMLDPIDEETEQRAEDDAFCVHCYRHRYGSDDNVCLADDECERQARFLCRLAAVNTKR